MLSSRLPSERVATPADPGSETMFHAWRTLRAFNRATNIFLLVCAVDAFGYFGIHAVLFNLYLLRLGFDARFIGLLIASGQLVWALAAFPAAALSRRLGLRTALILGSVLAAVGMGLALLVEGLPRPLWTGWLFGWWAVLWLGTALYSVNCPPYLMRAASAETRTAAFAAQGAVLALMGFAGSFVAGMLPGLMAQWAGASLEQAAPYRYGLWLAPISYLLCALLWLGAPRVKMAEATTAAAPPSKPLGLFVFFVVLVVLQTASEGVIPNFFTVYLDTQLGMPTAQLGTVLGVGQLLSVVGVLGVPLLVRRIGARSTLAWTTLGLSVALVPLALLPQRAAAITAFVAVSTLTAINGPVRTIFSQEMVLPPWRATTAALLTIGLAVGWASTAAFGGQLIARAGFSVLFLSSAGLALAAVVVLWAYRRAVSSPKPASRADPSTQQSGF